MTLINGIRDLLISITSGIANFYNSFIFGSFTLLGLVIAFIAVNIIISVFWKGGGS